MSWRRNAPSQRIWRVLRLRILDRDNWECVQCGRKGRLEVDHIKPLDVAPELALEESNLQCLCRGCHIRKTAGENRRDVDDSRHRWDNYLREEYGL